MKTFSVVCKTTEEAKTLCRNHIGEIESLVRRQIKVPEIDDFCQEFILHLLGHALDYYNCNGLLIRYINGAMRQQAMNYVAKYNKTHRYVTNHDYKNNHNSGLFLSNYGSSGPEHAVELILIRDKIAEVQNEKERQVLEMSLDLHSVNEICKATGFYPDKVKRILTFFNNFEDYSKC